MDNHLHTVSSIALILSNYSRTDHELVKKAKGRQAVLQVIMNYLEATRAIAREGRVVSRQEVIDIAQSCNKDWEVALERCKAELIPEDYRALLPSFKQTIATAEPNLYTSIFPGFIPEQVNQKRKSA